MTVVSFSGHRPDKLGGYKIPNPVFRSVCEKIEIALQDIKPNKAISGMALGVDQWAASICIKLGIPFVAAVPFKSQESKWPKESQKIYNLILSKASEVVIVCDGEYSSHKLQIRNEWMVDNCNKLIAVYNGTPGGTKNCVEYANKVNREIYRIIP